MEAKVYRTINGICVEVEKQRATEVADLLNATNFVEVTEIKFYLALPTAKIIMYELYEDSKDKVINYLKTL